MVGSAAAWMQRRGIVDDSRGLVGATSARRHGRGRRGAICRHETVALRRGVVESAIRLVVVIVVIVRAWRDDLTAGIRPAGRADAVRETRGVALRARVVRRRTELVRRTALRRAGVRLSLLRNGHEAAEGSACLAGGVLPDDVLIRPMREGEAPDVYELCLRVLFENDPNVTPEVQRARSLARIDHPRVTDPGGTWIAEHEGVVAGVAMGLVRERLWGFSLFAVDEHLQGRGVGRELLGRSLAYGEASGCEGWIILSSEKPAAMRCYGNAGFDLRPTIAAMGVPDLRRAPDGLDAVQDAGAAAIPLAHVLGRELRGAGYGQDLEVFLATGSRLLVLEDRAVVCAREGQVQLVLARDEEAASLVLWAALTTAPAGSTALVLFIDAGQQWAIRVALDARLPLTPDGPLCVRGNLGPLAPFLPSGAWL